MPQFSGVLAPTVAQLRWLDVHVLGLLLMGVLYSTPPSLLILNSPDRYTPPWPFIALSDASLNGCISANAGIASNTVLITQALEITTGRPQIVDAEALDGVIAKVIATRGKAAATRPQAVDDDIGARGIGIKSLAIA
jgi:hypothetical protein